MEEEWFNAARVGDDKRVAELLAEQPNLIGTKDQRRMNTALHFAAQEGHEAVVARLQRAARPSLLHARNFDGRAALDLAASKGHDKVVAQILATPSVVGFDISESLIEAVSGNRSRVVDLLLTARSPNFILPNNGRDAVRVLYCTIIGGSHKAFTRLLEICPGVLDEDVSSNAVHQAASHGHDDMVSQILSLRPQMIDVIGRDGCNVLMCAVESGHQRIAEMLLAIKPELISFVSKDGDTVLHHAVTGCKDVEFVAKLWRLNPQALTHTNNKFESPFHLAVKPPKKDELIELFQWSLPLDDIVEAFTAYGIDWQERYRPVMEPLFVSLNKDVAGTVLEYVGTHPAKPTNKSGKFS